MLEASVLSIVTGLNKENLFQNRKKNKSKGKKRVKVNHIYLSKWIKVFIILFCLIFENFIYVYNIFFYNFYILLSLQAFLNPPAHPPSKSSHTLLWGKVSSIL